jgi:hypothetical protein
VQHKASPRACCGAHTYDKCLNYFGEGVLSGSYSSGKGVGSCNVFMWLDVRVSNINTRTARRSAKCEINNKEIMGLAFFSLNVHARK